MTRRDFAPLILYENEPARLLVFPRGTKNGAAQPVTIEMPAHPVFHHGNARETGDGKTVFETVCGTDRRLLDALANSKSNKFVAHEPNKLEQLTIDLSKRAVVSRTQVGADLEFPTFDRRRTGQHAEFLTAVERDFEENAAVVRFDLKRNTAQKFYAGKNRTFGEAIFAPKTGDANDEYDENDGYLLAQGFDALRNETFLEIRGDAAALTSALQRSEKILAANPTDAETLVWHGSATLAQSGKAFQDGNFGDGAKLWKIGLAEMDKAVEIAPDSFAVRIVRGSTYLSAAKRFPDPAVAKELREKAVGDFEKILTLTDEPAKKALPGARARILNGLVEAYEKLGDKVKAKVYRQRLAQQP